jgi:hypothetical protein
MESDTTEREWYVRLENMYLNDSCVGYKRIITIGSCCSSLIEAILAYYHLPVAFGKRIRIWSTPFRMNRLDCLTVIPEEERFLSVEFR